MSNNKNIDSGIKKPITITQSMCTDSLGVQDKSLTWCLAYTIDATITSRQTNCIASNEPMIVMIGSQPV